MFISYIFYLYLVLIKFKHHNISSINESFKYNTYLVFQINNIMSFSLTKFVLSHFSLKSKLISLIPDLIL